MPDQPPHSFRAMRLIWIAVGAGFLAAGIPSVINPEAQVQHIAHPATTSSDEMIGRYTGLENGSVRILKATETLPPELPVALFWPEEDPNKGVLYQAISYLIWPRKVASVPSSPRDIAARVQRLSTMRLGAMIFCFFGPPPTPNAKIIGPIVVIPRQEDHP